MEKIGKIGEEIERTSIALNVSLAAKSLHDELTEQFDDEVYVQKLVIASMPTICESIARPRYIANVPLSGGLTTIDSNEMIIPLTEERLNRKDALSYLK